MKQLLVFPLPHYHPARKINAGVAVEQEEPRHVAYHSTFSSYAAR